MVAKGASRQPRCNMQEGAEYSANGAQTRRIAGNGELVNRGEVLVQFGGQNLTARGKIGLLHRFARKFSVEEAYPAYGQG